MAREWSGSTNTDRITFSVASSTQRSISTWFWLDGTDTTARRLWDWTNIDICFQDSTNLFRYGANWSTTSGQWEIAIPSTGLWQHLCITYDGSGTAPGNDPLIYINGSSQSVTERSTPDGTLNSGTNDLILGNRSLTDRCLDGKLAEYARWERILTIGEIATLAAGFSPIFLDPTFYAPIIGRYSPETQLVSSVTGTVTNTSNFAHPRIIYPSSGQIRRFGAAAAAAAGQEDWPLFQSRGFRNWRFS